MTEIALPIAPVPLAPGAHPAPAPGGVPSPSSPGLNTAQGPRRDFFDESWSFLTSGTLAYTTLSILALLAIVGTFVLQNKPYDELQRAYAPWVIELFSALGWFDVYRSTLFLFFSLVLALNVSAASIDRWEMIKRTVTERPSALFPARRRFSWRADLVVDSARADDVAKRFAATWGIAREETANGAAGSERHLLAHRNRFRRAGVYIIHAGLLTVLFGGMWGALTGEHGFIFLEPNGKPTNRYKVEYMGRFIEERPLPFSVACNKFNVVRFMGGDPKDYYSDLSLFLDGKEELRRTIEVNDPLGFAGYQLYQSSFQELSPEAVFRFTFTDRATGRALSTELQPGGVYTAPSGVKYRLVDFHPDLLGNGIAAQVERTENANTQSFWVYERFPGYDAIARPDATAVSLVEATTRPRYVTGLQVGRNPGAGIVFVGGFIMVVGLIYTFMFPHTRVWLRLAPEADGTHMRVSVAGWVDRSQVQFEDRFNAFVAGLTTGLQAVSLSPPANPSSGSLASADLESGNPAVAPGAPSTGVTP